MSHKLSPDVGKAISKKKACKWINHHTEKHPEKDSIRAHFFGSDIVNQILLQDKCVGLRIYYATNSEGVKQLLLVGAREDGSNIWPAGDDDDNEASAGGIIADASRTCPPYCEG